MWFSLFSLLDFIVWLVFFVLPFISHFNFFLHVTHIHISCHSWSFTFYSSCSDHVFLVISLLFQFPHGILPWSWSISLSAWPVLLLCLTLFSRTLCQVSIPYSHYISPSNFTQVLCFLDSAHILLPLQQESYLFFTFKKKWLVGWNITVIAILLQRISYLFSTCCYIRSHRIFSCCHNPLHIYLPQVTYKIRWELWIPVNLLEVITHQQRSHQQVKPKYNKRTQTQGEERATLEHPDKEIKETTSLNPIELLPQKFTL